MKHNRCELRLRSFLSNYEVIVKMEKCPWLCQSFSPTHISWERNIKQLHLIQHKEREFIADFEFIRRKSFFKRIHDFFLQLEPWNTPHTSFWPGLWSKTIRKLTNCRIFLTNTKTQTCNLTNFLRLSCSEWHHELKYWTNSEAQQERRENEKGKMRGSWSCLNREHRALHQRLNDRL